MTGDYQQCVKEYGDLIARYAADVVAHNNLALCSTHLRDMPQGRGGDAAGRGNPAQARALPRQSGAVRELRGRFPDWRNRRRERSQEPERLWRCWPWRLPSWDRASCLRRPKPTRSLGTIDALGASFAASGLGDLAVYEGRFSDAVRILEQGAAADLAAKNPDRAAAKFASLAYAQLLRGQKGAAIAAAEQGAGEQQGREDPIPGGASLRRGGRDRQEPDR